MASDENPAARPRVQRWGVAVGQLPTDRAIATAQRAERLGFERVLVGEHGLDGDAVLATAAVLHATRTIHCGPAIAHVLDRHPVVLTRGLAALGIRHPGRVFAGLGRSDPDYVVDQLGLSMGGGTAALADTIQIARGALRGERVNHVGAHWSAHLGAAGADFLPPIEIPLMLAAVGPRTLRLAGAIADGVVLNFGASPEYVAWAVSEVGRGAHDAGRDANDIDVLCFVLVAHLDDQEPDGHASARQLDAVRRTLKWMFAMPDQGDDLAAPTGGRPSDDSVAQLSKFAAIGDQAQCLAYTDALRAAGAGCVVLLASGMETLFPET